MNIPFKKFSEQAVIPFYATKGAAGFDLAAAEEVMLHPGQTRLVSTGLGFAVPEGFELQVRPRSGLSLRTGLRVILGTVDSDYRGIVHVIVQNSGTDSHRIAIGERIAQGIVAPVIQAQLREASELAVTERGAGGFGSTGLKVPVDLPDLIKEVIK
jgi:dUTP pyrophosphatase